MLTLDADEIRRSLTYARCIPLMREAMIALSAGRTRQLLRSILDLGERRLFGVMPGALGEGEVFGAKLVSVFPPGAEGGRSHHKGVVVLFEPVHGLPVCVAEAGEVTAIRTAAASAAATDVLALPGAGRLALLGCGTQAAAHARALAQVRPLTDVAVWGRSAARAQDFAARMLEELGLPVRAVESAQAAVADADIVCTLTSAAEPILEGRWVKPGAHVNLVGSSYAGPREADTELVVRSRFIADHREGVLAQGAEFLAAREAGLVDDGHVAAEIGEVMAGRAQGRQSPDQVTVYKSLGHIVQDLAAVAALWGDRAGAPPPA